MHDHEVRSMVDALVEQLAITPSQRTTVLEALGEHWRARIAIVWTEADVHHQANADGYVLTSDAARGILQTVLGDHDATVGVTWESFSGHYSDLALGVDCIKLPARYQTHCDNGGHVRLEQRGGSKICRPYRA